MYCPHCGKFIEEKIKTNNSNGMYSDSFYHSLDSFLEWLGKMKNPKKQKH